MLEYFFSKSNLLFPGIIQNMKFVVSIKVLPYSKQEILSNYKDVMMWFRLADAPNPTRSLQMQVVS